MAAILPKKLGKEPIIDAIFEVRFAGKLNAVSEILPGFLYSNLKGDKNIIPLANAQIPKSLRDLDPNLRFIPISRIEWQNFIINIGERVLSIGCKLPYVGWEKFKKAIENVLKEVGRGGFIDVIERCSMKYVDLIPSKNVSEQIKFLNFDMTIADHKLEKENFQARVEIPKNDFIHIIQFVSSSSIKFPNGDTKEGIVIDVDSICNLENIAMKSFLASLSKKLDSIHSENKSIFFSCLKSKTVKALEPRYD